MNISPISEILTEAMLKSLSVGNE